jgi:hypothetical protein
VRRDARADAAADHAGAPPGAQARRGPAQQVVELPPSRRQSPGHRPLRRGRQTESRGNVVISAQHHDEWYGATPRSPST